VTDRCFKSRESGFFICLEMSGGVLMNFLNKVRGSPWMEIGKTEVSG